MTEMVSGNDKAEIGGGAIIAYFRLMSARASR